MRSLSQSKPQAKFQQSSQPSSMSPKGKELMWAKGKSLWEESYWLRHVAESFVYKQNVTESQYRFQKKL